MNSVLEHDGLTIPLTDRSTVSLAPVPHAGGIWHAVVVDDVPYPLAPVRALADLHTVERLTLAVRTIRVAIWRLRQAELRRLAQAAGLCRPAMGDPSDLADLADALRADNPALSLDQAADAAAAMQPELREIVARYESRRAAAWVGLHADAADWDRRCAWHYATQTPVGRA